MKVGLLVIGSEVLNGKISDLNTRFLADFLQAHQLDLQMAITVKDIESEIHRALKVLFEICDLVVTSGGLGPTRDDITKMALATYLNRIISYSPEAEIIAQENYAKFERSFPGKEHGYSFLPQGFVALNNSSGFAPGLFTEHLGKYLFCAPGVPKEFKTMIQDHLYQLIFSKIENGEFLSTVTIRTKKVPEEKIFSEIDPNLWDKLAHYGDVASLPVLMGVDIEVKLRAKNQEELNQKKEGVLKVIDESAVKEHVWHFGRELLEEIIIQKANQKKLRFGFAESATGGLCSHRVTGISGSSNSFVGSVICYDTNVKINQLQVSQSVIEEFGVVSLETARAMASGIAQVLNLDIGISITGFAGPSGGTPDKPVGTVCIGTYVKGKIEAQSFRFYGDREQLKNRFAQAALMILLERMEEFA
ncbi:MAG: nicotinamide-nucleotide amidohydrolase family protein [Bacteriovoracaceae bacterium]